jgi:hypothetical protein
VLRCAESPTLARCRFDVVHLHSGSSLRFFAHDRILHRPALRVAGQFLAGRCCWGRLSFRPPLTRVIRRLLSSAWRTGPAHLSVRHRLAALLCGSAAALMGFDPSQCCSGEPVAEVSASTHLPFSRPCRAWAYVFPRTGRRVRSFCVPASRGLSIAASGRSGLPAVPSRRVGIGRYCLGLCLFQGCRARFALHRRIACRRGSRHLAPATGSRPFAGLDARLAARPIRS